MRTRKPGLTGSAELTAALRWAHDKGFGCASWLCLILYQPPPAILRVFRAPGLPPDHQWTNPWSELPVGLEFGGRLVSLREGEPQPAPGGRGWCGGGWGAGPGHTPAGGPRARVAACLPALSHWAKRRRWGVCAGWLQGPSHGKPLVTLALAGRGSSYVRRARTLTGDTEPWCSAGGAGWGGQRPQHSRVISRVSVRGSVSVRSCMCVCMHGCTHMCSTCMCARVYMCVHVCARVCVCMLTRAV